MNSVFSKNITARIFILEKFPVRVLCAQLIGAIILFFAMGVVADNLGYADEEEKRRVDISLSIFPRIVAVDNDFRSKLDSKNKVQLIFLFSESKDQAKSLVETLISENKNIGGMGVRARTLSVGELLSSSGDDYSTAIFLAERISDSDLKKVMEYAEKRNRIVFSPFTGDVERGVTVGISVTNRVKPYFNLQTLKRSGVVINALLMKMSKRYE